jgi:hypothetical protein
MRAAKVAIVKVVRMVVSFASAERVNRDVAT